MNNKIIPISKISTTEKTKESIVNALNSMGINSVNMSTSWSKIAEIILGIENYTVKYRFGEVISEFKNILDEIKSPGIIGTFERLPDIPIDFNDGFSEVVNSLETFLNSVQETNSNIEIGDQINRLINTSFTGLSTDTAPTYWAYTDTDNCNMVSTDKTTYLGALFRRSNAEFASVRGYLTQSITLETGKYTIYLQVDQKVAQSIGTNIRINSPLNGTIFTASEIKVGTNMFKFEVANEDAIAVDFGTGILEDTSMTQLDISMPYIHKGWVPFTIETGLN